MGEGGFWDDPEAAAKVNAEYARLQRRLPGWLDRRRVRVTCDSCGEGITYEREVRVGGRTLCRPCAGEGYYAAPETARHMGTSGRP